ncbi:hypothetical protein [Nocardia flavorosea]|uniref:Uncharacterized protein n=1 Tax=Nocardia flavorosea TaxID=53429 RepID=A0A846YQZ9_9NOCA|nr:hypothetical protein [Nocardia flavorosea]NKY60000.1 hypothetical protein [Nocardia flavorosea]
MRKLKPASRVFAAVVCGIGVVGAAVAGAGVASAHPGPGEKKIIVNGQERPDIDRVILRENLGRDLPGYQLPPGSPGVIILKNGEIRPAPEGVVLRTDRR